MFCTNCGNELNEKAVICPNCGVPTDNYVGVNKNSREKEGLRIAIKVLMIISCVSSVFSFLIPLAWCLPMTLHYNKTVNNGEKVGMRFKVCTLIFVNTIAGILMLCDD